MRLLCLDFFDFFLEGIANDLFPSVLYLLFDQNVSVLQNEAFHVHNLHSSSISAVTQLQPIPSHY